MKRIDEQLRAAGWQASGSPRKPALTSHAVNPSMPSSAVMALVSLFSKPLKSIRQFAFVRYWSNSGQRGNSGAMRYNHRTQQMGADMYWCYQNTSSTVSSLRRQC
jgi:hypothetical protein